MARAPIPLPLIPGVGAAKAAVPPNSFWSQLNTGIGNNSNALIGFGMGLLSKPRFSDALSQAGAGWMQGGLVDQKNRESDQAEKDKQDALARAAANAKFIGDPALSQAVAGGDMDFAQAYKMWQDEKNADPADPTKTAAGRQSLGKSMGLNGDALVRYILTGDLPADKTPSLPTSFQEFQLAQQNPDYAASLASSSSKPPTDAMRRGASLAEVVAPDAALLLGDGTPQNPGVFDALGNPKDQAIGIGGGLTRAATSSDYQRAMNALGNIAQSYLYAISGQAAPASEVAKIVDSVTPKLGESAQAVLEKKARLATYVRAIGMAAERNPAGTPDQPAGAPVATKTVNGKAYYQDENGDWYEQ